MVIQYIWVIALVKGYSLFFVVLNFYMYMSSLPMISLITLNRHLKFGLLMRPWILVLSNSPIVVTKTILKASQCQEPLLILQWTYSSKHAAMRLTSIIESAAVPHLQLLHLIFPLFKAKTFSILPTVFKFLSPKTRHRSLVLLKNSRIALIAPSVPYLGLPDVNPRKSAEPARDLAKK